jgi:hypothetical protein
MDMDKMRGVPIPDKYRRVFEDLAENRAAI